MEEGDDGTRVLIVEDHALLAQSLMFALRAEGLSVALADDLSAEGILVASRRHQPDIVLLDLDIGGELGTSLSLIGVLQERGARVVMVTGVTDRGRLGACIEAGAIGLISKADPFEELVEGVKEAVTLGTLLSPAQRDDLLAELRRQRTEAARSRRRFEQLTPREAQVLGGLIDGLTADQIARRSVVSLATVRSQIRAVLLKLGVHTQLAAVALARDSSWAPPADD